MVTANKDCKFCNDEIVYPNNMYGTYGFCCVSCWVHSIEERLKKLEGKNGRRDRH